ncbi:MAG: hypothetical protein WBD27_06425 [Pyrinomonadaceae bacterium]
MSLPTLKIYVVSVSACQKSEDLLDTAKGMLYYEHSPVVVTGVNMQMAADQSRHIALNKWKIEDGWSMHSASITAVTREFFDQGRLYFKTTCWFSLAITKANFSGSMKVRQPTSIM